MDLRWFYDRLTTTIGRPLTEYDQGLLGPLLRRTLPYDFPVEFIPVEDAAARLAKGKIGYWLYDRKSKTWIINMETGCHECLAGTLYGIYTDDDNCDLEEMAERYIDNHCGCFVSASMQMYIPIKSPKMMLTSDERFLETAKGKLAWRGID